MGNIPHFSIGYTQSKKLKNLNKSPCDISINKTKELILKKLKKIEKIENFRNSKDYKKYHLFPGQQLRRSVRNTIFPHTAIYIYDGIIFEMGTGPKKCSKTLGNPFHITENLCGLSTIDSFEKYAKKHSKEIHKITTENDDNKEEIISRIKRILEIVGKYEYNFITNNCLHMANYVSHDSKAMLHYKNINKQKHKREKVRRTSRRSRKNY